MCTDICIRYYSLQQYPVHLAALGCLAGYLNVCVLCVMHVHLCNTYDMEKCVRNIFYLQITEHIVLMCHAYTCIHAYHAYIYICTDVPGHAHTSRGTHIHES